MNETGQIIIPFPRPIYRIGSLGDPEAVKEIQTRLIVLDCYKGEATGKFDEATANAVIAFRKATSPQTTITAPLTGLRVNVPLYSPEVLNDGAVDSEVLQGLFPGGIDQHPSVLPTKNCKP